MPQKFAFTTAAMAAALEETPVSYEDLADIEREFDDAETEISKLYLLFFTLAQKLGGITHGSLYLTTPSTIPNRTPITQQISNSS